MVDPGVNVQLQKMGFGKYFLSSADFNQCNRQHLHNSAQGVFMTISF
jgi:hypothetical protein